MKKRRGFFAQGAESAEKSRIATGYGLAVSCHAGAFEKRACAAHGGEGFGAGRERIGEVSFDKAAGQADAAVARVDDDAGDRAEVGIDAGRGFSLVRDVEPAGPGERSPPCVERGTRNDQARDGLAISIDEGEDGADRGGLAGAIVKARKGEIVGVMAAAQGERIGWVDAGGGEGVEAVEEGHAEQPDADGPIRTIAAALSG